MLARSPIRLLLLMMAVLVAAQPRPADARGGAADLFDGFSSPTLRAINGLLAAAADPATDDGAAAAIAGALHLILGGGGESDAEIGAIALLERGATNAGLEKIVRAVELLDVAMEADPALDLSDARARLTEEAQAVAEAAAEIALAALDRPMAVERGMEAHEMIGEGRALAEMGFYAEAARLFMEAHRRVQGFLTAPTRGGSPEGSRGRGRTRGRSDDSDGGGSARPVRGNSDRALDGIVHLIGGGNTREPTMAGWGIFPSSQGPETMQYVGMSRRGRALHLASEAERNIGGRFIIGDDDAMDWNEHDEELNVTGMPILGLWMRNDNVGERFWIVAHVRTIDAEGNARTRTLFYKTQNGGDHVAGNGNIRLHAGPEWNDGEWHYFSRNLEADLDRLVEGENIVEVDAILFFCKDIYVDEITLRRGWRL